MKNVKFYLLCFIVCSMQLLPTSAISFSAFTLGDQVSLLAHNKGYPTPIGECWRRMGPFVTQSTAWDRLRQAESQGYVGEATGPFQNFSH